MRFFYVSDLRMMRLFVESGLMNIRRKAAYLLLLPVLAWSLSACGSDAGESAPALAKDGQPYSESDYESGIHTTGEDASRYFVNLAQGCQASASAEEDAAVAGAAQAVDGDSSTMWMAGNESNQLVIDFGSPVVFSYLRILWGSVNITSYTLEISDDGQSYTAFYTSDVPPYLEEDLIDLTKLTDSTASDAAVSGSGDSTASDAATSGAVDSAFDYVSADGHVTQHTLQNGSVSGRYLRLSVTGAALIRELCVYEENPWKALEEELSASIVEVPDHGSDGGTDNGTDDRTLSSADSSSADGKRLVLMLDGVPAGITAEFGGCNYEQIIDETRGIHLPLEEKIVQVGYRLTYGDWTEMTSDLAVVVPAAGDDQAADSELQSGSRNKASSLQENAKPEVIPALQEWRGGAGALTLTDETKDAIHSGEAFIQASAQGSGQVNDQDSNEGSDPAASQIEIEIPDDDCGVVGTEGYEIVIDDDGIHVAVSGSSSGFPSGQGLVWAWRTLQQMMDAADRDSDGHALLPEGSIRDYPEYVSRGFEIDVARSFVSMETLYKVADLMSRYKMNELTIHLNDNEILSSAGYSSAEEAMEKGYAAYRMESAEGLTSSDGSYTRQEFSRFVSYAASIGVKVIPEIDTPAHSLAITKVFPELAETYEPAAVQYLDLSNPSALEIVEKLWSEQSSFAAFAGCDVLHIGGDEYYGSAADYVNYENSLLQWMKDRGRTPRLWGSLSRIRNAGETRVSSDGVQMLLWNSYWADPETMLRAGFSLINADSSYTYIVPGSANDYLDKEKFAAEYHVNTPLGCVLPSWSPQVLGGQITLWNDYSRTLGISEEEILKRVGEALPAAAGRFWRDEGPF